MTAMLTSEDRRGITLTRAGIQVRADGDGARRFVGHAAVFGVRTAIGNPLRWGFYEEVAPGAFTKTLAEADTRMLLDHSSYHVVSRVSAGTLTLAQDKDGLAVDSALDTNLSYVNDLIANLDNRNITGMSFGFYVVKDEWWEEQVELSDGNNAWVEVRRLLELALVEVSAVTFPAYEATDAALRAGNRAEDEVRAVGLALRRRDDAAEQFEARAQYCPDLARYFDREHAEVRADDAPADDDTHVPPKTVQKAAQKGLDAVADGKGGDGLTAAGKAMGKKLAAGGARPLADVRKINAYFARHAEADEGQQDEEGTPAWVAWQLWGGDPGQRWAKKIVTAADKDGRAAEPAESTPEPGETTPDEHDPHDDGQEPGETTPPTDGERTAARMKQLAALIPSV